MDAAQVSWHLVACFEDPELIMDEGECADLMLTGKLPCRIGLHGVAGHHSACCCRVDYWRPEDLKAMGELAGVGCPAARRLPTGDAPT